MKTRKYGEGTNITSQSRFGGWDIGSRERVLRKKMQKERTMGKTYNRRIPSGGGQCPRSGGDGVSNMRKMGKIGLTKEG